MLWNLVTRSQVLPSAGRALVPSRGSLWCALWCACWLAVPTRPLAQAPGASGNPASGDTQASETPEGAKTENFDRDDTPPGTGVEPQLAPMPLSSRPVHQYGRRDPFMPIRLDGHVGFTWDGAFGVGLRVDFPVISGTFRYRTRDELAISVGGDVTFISFNGSRVVEVFPTAVLQWSLGLNDRWFVYPELGLLGHINDGDWDGLRPNVGFGGRYYIHRSFSVHARFGWPIAFSAGATF